MQVPRVIGIMLKAVGDPEIFYQVMENYLKWSIPLYNQPQLFSCDLYKVNYQVLSSFKIWNLVSCTFNESQEVKKLIINRGLGNSICFV